MKPKLLLLVLPVLCPILLFAQYPCANGISTNPSNPINNQLPSKLNTFFNWHDSLWSLQPSPNCFRTSQVESPFYKIDNAEVLRESKDMNWSDGWELIRRGVGLTEGNTYTASNPEHIYVILYNKYTGILRILLQTCRGEDYTAARVRLAFHSTSIMKTDLLEFSRGEITALDKTFTNTTYAAGAEYFNENSKWFYADFPMMFDPCTCIYKSKLNIVSELISNSQITIEGTITGEIYTQTSGGYTQIQKPGSYSWKDFVSGVNRYAAVNASVDQFRSETQKFAENIAGTTTVKQNRKDGIDSLAKFLKNNSFLKTVLQALPWLKSAVGLLNAFIGGGKQTPAGPQEVKLLPLSANLTCQA